MVDKTKVPEYQVQRVLFYSQPTQNKVVKTQSDKRRPPIWTLKLGRENTFAMRCDRAVREAIARGWCYEDDNLGLLRPTDEGYIELATREREIEASVTTKFRRTADVMHRTG